MSHSNKLPSFIGLAVLAALIGSMAGAALFGLYIFADFYWHLYQEFGEHWLDMGVTPPRTNDVLIISALFSSIFTLSAALVVGVPLAYSFRKQIFSHPKTSTLVLTVLGTFVAVAMSNLLLRNTDAIDAAIPIFGAATAFAYSILIVGFRSRLNVCSEPA